MEFSEPTAESAFLEHVAQQRVKQDLLFNIVQITVYVVFTSKLNRDPEADGLRALLWGAALVNFAILALLVLNQSLYVRVRTALLATARVLLTLLIRSFIRSQAHSPIPGSCILASRSFPGLLLAWSWYSRVLMGQIAIAGLLTPFKTEAVLLPACIILDIMNNAQTCKGVVQYDFYRSRLKHLEGAWWWSSSSSCGGGSIPVAAAEETAGEAAAGAAAASCAAGGGEAHMGAAAAAGAAAQAACVAGALLDGSGSNAAGPLGDDMASAAASCELLFLFTQLALGLALPLLCIWVLERRDRRAFLAKNSPEMDGVELVGSWTGVAVLVVGAAVLCENFGPLG